MLIVAKLKTTFQISNNKKITQIIFLPANSQMEDSIVFLDKIYHVDNRFINRDTLEDQRLFLKRLWFLYVNIQIVDTFLTHTRES